MAATETFANEPSTTVSSGGTTAPASGTSQSWTVASSAPFPSASTGSTQFHVADPALPSEIIAVTNISGTTWTVTRGAESTTPLAHTAGFTVYQVVSAGAYGQFIQSPSGPAAVTGSAVLGQVPMATSSSSAIWASHPVEWINAVTEYSADPTGAADSAPAISNALAACSPGMAVYLPRGKYKVNGEINIPPNVGLIGDPATAMVQEEQGTDPGSVIQPSSSFSATHSNSPSVIRLLTQAEGSYSTVSQGQYIEHIMIDGSQYTATPIHGVGCYGTVQRVWMNRVQISQMSGDGVHAVPDATPNLPDAWTLSFVFARFCTGDGFHLVRLSDSSFTSCLQTNSGGVGWYVDTATNCQFASCRSEHAGTYGYQYLNSASSKAGSVLFTGCTTDQSTLNGFYIASGVTGGPVQLVGCLFHRDGQNGGSDSATTAGISVNAYSAPVIITGCQVYPGVNDNGSGVNAPHNGILLTGANGLVQISGSFFQGATNAVNDDGNGYTLWDTVSSLRTGTQGSPTTVQKQNLALLTGSAAPSYGSGTGVIFIANGSVAPSTNPSGGGVLYVSSGALKFKGSSGTVTNIAPA